MKVVRIVLATLIIILIATTTVGAEEKEKISLKVSGLAFGDMYYFASSHDSAYQNEFGFWIRRIFLGLEVDLTHGFTSLLRFEMNQPDGYNGGSGNMIPYIRDASLSYAFSGQKASFGIIPPPGIALVEGWWGYRYIEKTLTDLQKVESTRDLGLSMKGNVLRNGVLQYQLMYGNGSGTGPETDIGKAIFGALQVYPVENLVVEIFGKYEGFDSTGIWTSSGQIFLGYRNDIFSAGAQYYVNFTETGNPWMGLSLFGDVAIAEKWAVFLRTDMLFDGTYQNNGASIPYLPFDDSADSNYLLVVGVDFNPVGDVHISPNLEAVFNVGGTNGNDFVPRLTAFWSF